ncbi:MAG: hypothetical protein LWX83_00260 [Anaerolineae bacterium]|nr:hypothetical protein [Anaerolineae bacterium]
MKRINPFLGLVLLILTACVQAPQISSTIDATPSATSVVPTARFIYPPDATPIIPQDQKEGLEKTIQNTFISPDGQWLVSFKNDTHPVAVTSLLTHKTIWDTDLELVGKGMKFSGWFSDSSGFVLSAINYVCNDNCPVNRLIMYRLEVKNNVINHQIYDLPPDKFFISGLMPSPDVSRYLAIVRDYAAKTDRDEIYIVNHQAELLQKVKLPLSAGFEIKNLYWVTPGLIYTVRNSQNPSIPYTLNLYLLDPARTERPQTLFYSINGYPQIISMDPLHRHLLIYRHNDQDGGGKAEFLIFNLRAKQIEKTIPSPVDDIVKYAGSDDSSVVALQSADPENNLFMFYWQTRSLVDRRMHIGDLNEQSWNPDLTGFVVYCGDNAGHQWTRLVQP